MRDFHSSIDESHLVDGLDLWGETSVNAEDLSFDDSADAKVVEHFGAVLPWIGIAILSNSLIVKSVHGGDLPGLVVASKQGDVGWILQLEAQQELECLNGVEPSVDEISHEDVSGVGDLTALIEKFQKIVELTMDISADSDRSLDWLHIALFDQDLFDLLAKDSQLSFWQNGTVLDGLKPIIDDVLTHFFSNYTQIFFI